MSSFIKKYGENYYNSEHEINGKKRQSMNSIFNRIDFKIFENNSFYSMFHGDLQFDNVIYSKINNEFKYIDWRDSFGKSTEGGDVYYDLSKLYGGLLIPYNIMKDDSKIQFKEGSYSINYSYELSENLIKFRGIYENWITDNGFDLNKIKLITGLIFLNMSPLHDGKFGKMLWFKSIEMLDDYDK
jgi:thiamine kinase-like enzyme